MTPCMTCGAEKHWTRRGLCWTCYHRAGRLDGYRRQMPAAITSLKDAACVSFEPSRQQHLQRLFASTAEGDHMEARALCDTCPALLACATALSAARADATPGYGPEGTWAGRLVRAKECAA